MLSSYVCSSRTRLGESSLVIFRLGLKCRPIVLLAFTNHALDHILRSIHENGVTENMLRLGSRSKDEVVAQYSLESVERIGNVKTSLHAETAKYHNIMLDLKKVRHSTHLC